MYKEKDSYIINILEYNEIEVKKITRVFKDNVEISKKYHKHVLKPGKNVIEEIEKVKKIVELLWTEEVINDYKLMKEKLRLEHENR